MRAVLVPDFLIDGSGSEPLQGHAVRIEGGRIAEVGPAAQLADAARSEGVEVQELSGTLIPGIIDAHVHLAWGLDGQPLWDQVGDSPEGRLAWAQAGAEAALVAGITTLRDCGAPGFEVVRLRNAIRSGLTTGPTILACGPALTTTAGHADFIGVSADSADEVRLRIRQLCLAGVDFIKVMASGGDMDPHTNRLRAQYSDEEMAALAADAKRLRLPVVAHCNPTEAIRQAVDTGIETIAHCNWLGAEDGTIDYEEHTARRLIEAGIFVDLNIEGTLNPYAGGDGHAQVWDQPDPPRNRWELLREIREAGLALLTSDEFGYRIADFTGLLERMVNETNCTAAQVVHHATSVPAKAIGHGSLRGEITEGRLADLVLLDGDLGSDATAFRRTDSVWLSGRKVVSAGQLIYSPYRGKPEGGK